VRENLAIVAAILTTAILESCSSAINLKGRPLTDDELAEIRVRHVSEWARTCHVVLTEIGRKSPGSVPGASGASAARRGTA
jgi:hypothetical protein